MSLRNSANYLQPINYGNESSLVDLIYKENLTEIINENQEILEKSGSFPRQFFCFNVRVVGLSAFFLKNPGFSFF